ncbi:MAG: hypothetical protein KatS3mg094_204 [Candidatus Parcubacteria bacterium]|nr:MAG: hypothetical protein KatS3mg094_204 [Candidatus Parcubacteria bacterium]
MSFLENYSFSLSVVYFSAIIVGILGLFVIYLTVLYLKKFSELKRVRLSLNYSLILIELPKYHYLPKTESHTSRLIDEINNFENFLNTLSRLKYPIVFEIATPHYGEEIFFYISIPKKYFDPIQKAIKAFWPGSEARLVEEDYNIFNPQGITLGSYINLKDNNFKPIKTYQEIAQGTNDPLDSFLASFNKLKKVGEGMSYQVIIYPKGTKYSKKIKKIIDKLKQGKDFKENPFSSLHDIFSSKEAKEKKEIEERQKPIDDYLIKKLENKMTKPFFDVNIRLCVSSNTIFDAEELLTTAESAFHQYINPQLNEFIIHRVKRGKMLRFIYEFSFRIFNRSQKIILNSEEIASIIHLPTSYTKSPIIHWLLARTAPPPPNLPSEGTILGESIYQGARALVRIKKNDRRRHIYLIGQTGTGKTTLLKNIAEQDIKNGDGICFIDPHGDVAQEIMGLIPKERIDDVIYFSPGDISRPLGLNILEYDKNFPEQKTFIINTLIEIIDKLYNLSLTGGPMFEQYLRNALLLIMDNPDWGFTLMEVSRVFVDEKFRRELLLKCTNYPVVEFWTKQAVVVGGELSLENMITWITSKLNPFITNDFVRPIIAQSKSVINFRDLMDNRKILIVNLSKGKIGDTSAYLLGMILVAKILSAAFSRVDLPEEQRKDFYLFLDEFQNFAFKGIASILSEARKYRLSLTLAHQYIKQLPEEISSAVFGNVGTITVFRVGSEDAEFLEKQFYPIFSKIDLVNIPNYHLYIKLLIDGYVSDAFSIKTIKPSSPNFELTRKMIEYSLLKYGKSKEEIEKEIEARYKYISSFA